MPVVELASASLCEDEYQSAMEGSSCINTSRSSGAISSDWSSTKGRLGGTNFKPRSHLKQTESTDSSNLKNAFTNFTASLSHTSSELQDGVHKTFTSIVGSFSRDTIGNDSGYEASDGSNNIITEGKHQSYPSNTSTAHWSEYVIPERLRSQVSSISSRSSGGQLTANSTLSSRSQSPRMNADNIQITVNKSGLLLREEDGDSSDDSGSSTDDDESEATWQETASRDVSLLDTIGEDSGGEGGEEGSYDESDVDSEGSASVDDETRGLHTTSYNCDDDSDCTEFNSDVGLEDLGAAMLQIGSCHFEAESDSQDEDEDYSFTSKMFPPVVSKYMSDVLPAQSQIESESGRSDLFRTRLKGRNRPPSQQQKETSISSFVTRAFSCGGGYA